MIKFGTDGWRGVIAEDFTFENLEAVTQAIAEYLKKQKRTSRVVVGYDCRFLSRESAVHSGLILAANGFKTTLSHTAVPTPVVSFHCLHNKYDLGLCFAHKSFI